MRTFVICILNFVLMLVVSITSAYSQEEMKSEQQQNSMQKFDNTSTKIKTNRSKNADLIKAHLDTALQFSSSNAQKAINFVEKAMKISIEQKDIAGEARSYIVLGKINTYTKQYPIAIENFNKSIDLYTSIGDRQGLYEAYRNIALAYEANGEYGLALENFVIFHEKAKSAGIEADEIVAKKKIAGIYYLQQNYKLALKSYKEVLIIEKKNGDNKGIIEAYDRVGNTYLKIGDDKAAMENFKLSAELAEKSKDDKIIYQSLNNISQVYRSNKAYDQELELRHNSIDYNTLNNNPDFVANDNYEIGNIYVEQNNSQQAIPFFQNTVKISENTGNLNQKKEALFQLSTAYDDVGESKKALQSYKEYVNTMDSLYKQKEQDLLASLDMNNSLNRKLQRIELLEKDKEINEQRIQVLQREQDFQDQAVETQKIVIYSLTLGIILISIASLLVYRSSQQKRKANQLLALKSLRSQMNPHFIFNALNSVNSFISKSDERSANKYLSDFSRLMRMVMENSKHDFVSLTSEVTVLTLYLSLEHFRFKEKFDYEFDIDPEIDQDYVEIPPMLIQPYIENSVWHGLRYKEEKGYLKVKMTQKNKNLIVEIEDNGIGRKRSEDLKTKNQRENVSTGMKNIENRVKIINELHKSKMGVNVTDLNEDGSGTKVTIVIYSNGKD